MANNATPQGPTTAPEWIPNLKYWVQLVTPLVYDDSLSLYEVMRKVVYKLNQVIDIVNPLGAGIEDTIKQYLDKYQVEWEKELQEYQAQMTAVISTNNQQLNERIDKLTSDTQEQQAKFEAELTAKMDEVSAELVKSVATIAATIHTVDEANRAWTEALFESLKTILTDEFPPVIDPSDGQLESIQTALNHMWSAFTPDALEAAEYDALQLTAEEYDAHDLTATNYDRYGKLFLQVNSGGGLLNAAQPMTTGLDDETVFIDQNPTGTVWIHGIPLRAEVIDWEALRNG